MKLNRFDMIPQFTPNGEYQVNYTLAGLVRFIDEEIREQGLNLAPRFQRAHVWTEKQQIAWLEYHLRGGRSGNTVYLNHPGWHSVIPDTDGYSDYVCVDGLQRITAAQKFINNELKVFGSYYAEFEDSIRTLPNTVAVNVNDLKSEREVLQWYLDINSGGTPHTETELNKVRRMLTELERKETESHD